MEKTINKKWNAPAKKEYRPRKRVVTPDEDLDFSALEERQNGRYQGDTREIPGRYPKGTNPRFHGGKVESSEPQEPSQTGRRERREQPKENQQLIYGLRPVMEAIGSEQQLDKVFIQTGAGGALIGELKAMLNECGIPFQYVPVEKLNRLTKNNHQGVVATISPIRYRQVADLLPILEAKGRVPYILMLDHVTDVRNLGAIARTAECAGVDAIVVPDHGSAQINEDAIKSSSGALLRIPVCREQNLKTVVNLSKQYGLQICGATEKGATSYLKVDFTQPTLLIMGAEETGISNDLLNLCDVRAKLPICGEIQSLNVSVAAAIFMYEKLRQRES